MSGIFKPFLPLMIASVFPIAMMAALPPFPGVPVSRPTVKQDPPIHAAAVFDDVDRGRRIAFVIEAKGSMLVKWTFLKEELDRTLADLLPEQTFGMVFFQPDACDEFSPALLPASPANKKKAVGYLDTVTVAGYTDPIPGLEAAFREKADVIYLLADGDFPDNDVVLQKIHELNRDKRVKIYTIAFVRDGEADAGFIDLFKTIARETHGHYKHVNVRDL